MGSSPSSSRVHGTHKPEDVKHLTLALSGWEKAPAFSQSAPVL
jgi:hypothetical protein